jgi:hypothetical protein
MWRGLTVAVMASGPSMSEAVAETVRLHGVPTIAVNSTFRLAPWADALYAADKEWWEHPDNADTKLFKGLKITVSKLSDPSALKLLYTGVAGFDPSPDSVRSGMNSGYQAVHVAMHARARKIVLCGFNLGGTNWHGPHPKGLQTSPDWLYDKMRKLFVGLVEPARELGIEIVNCTPNSALEAFRRGDLDEELSEC